MITYAGTFIFFLFWFLLDFIFAGICKTFSFQTIRFLLYLTVIRGGSAYAVSVCGCFMLLESFVMYGLFGLDLCIAIPLIMLAYGFKDIFDNHWLLQVALAVTCYLIHGYFLIFLERMI